jgi:hypothetical protein
MDDQRRLRQALDRILPPPDAGPDPYADLARARRAARARRVRRTRLGLAAASVVVVAGVGVAAIAEHSGHEQPVGSVAAPITPITLVASRLHAAPYAFDLTPKGWSVQANTPYLVTIVPDHGDTSADPDVFVGKLVITYDHERPGGELLVEAGVRRAIWVHVDAGYTTMSMRTRRGEPSGVVRIQYPDDAGWDRSTMARFLLSVHVGQGARASQG